MILTENAIKSNKTIDIVKMIYIVKNLSKLDRCYYLKAEYKDFFMKIQSLSLRRSTEIYIQLYTCEFSFRIVFEESNYRMAFISFEFPIIIFGVIVTADQQPNHARIVSLAGL